MTRRKNSVSPKKKIEKTMVRCIDCANSYDHFEIAYDTGQPFLCKCKCKEWGHFLYKEQQCEDFIAKQ